MNQCAHMYCCGGGLCQAQETKRLTALLERQSEQLALALRAKNDWVKKHEFRLQEISALERRRDELTGDFSSLGKSYDAIVELNDCHLRELTSTRSELFKLKDELAKLRPKPKFRVGQVVKYGNGYLRIFAMRTNAISTGLWEYELTVVGWRFEHDLRTLTDEEKAGI